MRFKFFSVAQSSTATSAGFFILALSSAALNAVASLFPSFFVLAWVAFVPFLIGINLCRGVWQVFRFGLLTGLLTFAFSTYWMAEFITIFKGYQYLLSVGLASFYWFYCAFIFVFIALATYVGKRSVMQLWLFPTALAITFAVFPVLFSWQIGNSQHPFLIAIQGVSVTGVSGLDFIIGLVNALIARSLYSKESERGFLSLAAYCSVLTWFVYGAFSLHYWDKVVSGGDKLAVGIVQINGPPSIGTPKAPGGYSLSYPPEMVLTEQLAQLGAALVVWPEYDKQYYNIPEVTSAFQDQVAALKTPIIFQSVEEVSQAESKQQFSSVTLLNAEGQETAKYQKVKRIAVAEYLPWFGDSPSAKSWLVKHIGSFFGDYQAGDGPVRFDLTEASLTPLICYEAILSRFVAHSVVASGGEIITVQSNNSWFGNSRVPYQHMGASVLRSVENRRPLIHAMNNGLGGVVAASGRVLLQTDPQTVAGYLIDVPHSDNPPKTIYQRCPWLTLSVFSIVFIALICRSRSDWCGRQSKGGP